MRKNLTFIAAAFLAVGSLALVVPACDGGDGVDPNADEDEDGFPQKDDCDDTKADVNPDGKEQCSCDGDDDDCNGKVDDFDCDLVCYPPIDSDNDGFEPPEDCNDQNPDINPNAEEPCECDTVDQDCSGEAQDFACDLVCYFDNDNDGYDTKTDCNDQNGGINPGAAEACECDQIDQNCDGDITDIPGGDCMVMCVDGDGDGVFAENDCNDDDATISPDVPEKCLCDAIDQDCSGDPLDFDCDLACLDNDGDGVVEGPDCDDQNPDAKPGPGPEPCLCDAADNDCNGMVDDFDAACMATCTYLVAGDPCTAETEPYCGAGLACCADGAAPAACVTKCTGPDCVNGCPAP